jgi:hypothetical protein
LDNCFAFFAFPLGLLVTQVPHPERAGQMTSREQVDLVDEIGFLPLVLEALPLAKAQDQAILVSWAGSRFLASVMAYGYPASSMTAFRVLDMLVPVDIAAQASNWRPSLAFA